MKSFIKKISKEIGDQPLSPSNFFGFAIGLSNDYETHQVVLNQFLEALQDINLEGLDPNEIKKVYPVLDLLRIAASNNYNDYEARYNTVANFVHERMEGFKKALGHDLVEECRSALLFDIHQPLVENFVEIAAKQLNYFEADPDQSLARCLSLVKKSVDGGISEHFQEHYYFNQTLSKLSQDMQSLSDNFEKIQSAVRVKISEIKADESYEAITNMFAKAEKNAEKVETGNKTKINTAISTLESIKNDLTAGQNLKEIAEKQDLGLVRKFIDDAIQFFKSIVGKDRTTKATTNINKFSEKISKKEITPDKIKLTSAAGIGGPGAA